MGYLNLILKFLRLGPLALGAIAIAITGLGYFLQVKQNEDRAETAAALAAGPPAAVDIADFDRDQHMGLSREVVVQAQPLLDVAYRLTLEKDGPDSHVFMIPLVGATSTSETEIMGIAFMPSADYEFTNITPELLMHGMVGFGDLAPVIAYNGELKGMGQWDDLTEESFADEGLVMPDNPVVVWPYLQGRDVALAPPAPDDWTIFGVLSKIAGVIGLFALAKVAFRPARDPEPESLDDGGTDAGADPVRDNIMAAMDDDTSYETQAMYEPEPAAFEPDPAPYAPEPEYTDAELFGQEPARRGFGLRKVLIGLIGAAFVVLLGAVVWDMIGQQGASPEPAQAAVTSPQEFVAQAAADAIVPDADPNRHWTDIDVTPVVEWFVAKGMLAAAGDMDAIKTLGMIFGGVIAALFALRWFFVMRRVLTPKTTARIDSMGL